MAIKSAREDKYECSLPRKDRTYLWAMEVAGVTTK